ncbi:unnamed protein product [Albugo candida]|uniref:Uncharacterized protein n=1 Tax=Albugo candida TaxID=65357 RepID=A0A024FUR9_9STRA|nr:unnamed protein product [Albugo candida]|eukprot:CCI10893.1 unnamed protein product [Albugo candida]
MCVQLGYEIQQYDLDTAFNNEDLVEYVYMSPPIAKSNQFNYANCNEVWIETSIISMVQAISRVFLPLKFKHFTYSTRTYLFTVERQMFCRSPSVWMRYWWQQNQLI